MSRFLLSLSEEGYRFLERVKLVLASVMKRRAHHLGDVESFGEFFDFLVAVNDRLLQGSTSDK